MAGTSFELAILKISKAVESKAFQRSLKLGVFVGEGLGVGVGVGVDEVVGVGVGVGLGVGVAEIMGVGDGVTCDGEVDLIFIPLLQTNFLPDLKHVYLVFAMVLVAFNFMHFVPAIFAELAGTNVNIKITLEPAIRTRDLVLNIRKRLVT